MPGIIMESGSRNGGHTNHDRDTMMNGANGARYVSEKAMEKVKDRAESQPSQNRAPIANGINGTASLNPTQQQIRAGEPVPKDMADRIRQLPPEINHITEGFEPLSRLLTRLAQVTHNRLFTKIQELAAISTPMPAVNGNGMHYANSPDDNSAENIKKKVNLLKFAEETHANWTKALVISQWSRVSEDVGKLIDLKVHLDNQRLLYEAAVYELSEAKRSLVTARVPNPDLRTAVEVLSTGKVSWMPDLGYIEPPPMTAEQLLKSLQNLNTLLSIRLNLHEYDKIPPQFKDFSIKSGRVTFRVAGEFEVDLTIADENPETQFWFIDFRFLFSPALPQLPENLRYMIEGRVNFALEKDGLVGCYKFLHELVLTHKISELRRQAIELSRGRWIDTLQVEPLHRALSIQYWADRYGKDGPKSWIIIGVHSGKRADGRPNPNTTSYISIRWFRDSKEVKDHMITLDLTELSAESLLQSVISLHISYILESTYSKLRTKSLFSNRELSISIQPAEVGQREPGLTLQLTRHNEILIMIEPITGRFAISPASRLATQAERKLNSQTKDPATNAHDFIENLRCVTVSEEVISRALTVEWQHIRYPGLKQEDLKPIVPRDTLQLSWFRRPGWGPEWVVALSSSMSGERWWLIEILNGPQGPKVKSHCQIPLKTTSLNPTHAFLSALRLFTAAIISQRTNVRDLHTRRVPFLLRNESTRATSSLMQVPAVFVKMADLLPSRNKSPRTGRPWASNTLKIGFQGVSNHSRPMAPLPTTHLDQHSIAAETQASNEKFYVRREESLDEKVTLIAESSLLKPMPLGLELVKQRVDKNIAFHPTSGGFAFRLSSKIGESAIEPLIDRLQRIEQLVDFIDVVKKHEKTLRCETVSLGQVIFRYGISSIARAELEQPDAMSIDQREKIYHATVDFGGASMTLTLERGNPHIRVLESLTKVLNSPLGLNGVATLLPLTLPLMTALSAIEDAWTTFDHGEVLIFSRAVDWHVVRYSLNRISLSGEPRPLQKITFGIRLAHRSREPWWCIRREKERERNENKSNAEPDDIDTALKVIWEDNLDGEQWRGMSACGIARVTGVEELIGKVDAIIRDYSISTSASQAVAAALDNMQLIPPARQQSNQGHGHGQGNMSRKSGIKRETIVID